MISSGNCRQRRSFRLLFLFILSLGIFIQTLNGYDIQRGRKPFLSHMMLLNKAYPNPVFKLKMEEESLCRAICERNEECFAYAFSEFARMCQIYKYVRGMEPQIQNSYNLFIAERNEQDGFFKYGMGYVKLFLKHKTAYDAQKTCDSLMEGSLLPVRDKKLNDFIHSLMDYRKVFFAYIGLTDAAEEGTWTHFDGTPASYFNWHYKGMWNRTDKNCVLITANSEWRQTNCYDKFPFFCHIPFY